MTTYSRGQFWIYTFKEGLLSSVAHDLRLSMSRFQITLDGAKVEGLFWGDSLNIDGVMKQGTLDEKALNFLEKAQIKRVIRKEILQTQRFPTAAFSGTLVEQEVNGELTLKSRQQPLSLSICGARNRVSGTVEITPSQWGIAPYSALLGTLKLQDRVLIEFDVEAHL